MSTEPEHARVLAERIARRLATGQPSPSASSSNVNVSTELAAVRASINDLQQKLARLEASVGTANSDFSSTSVGGASYSERAIPLTHSPWLAGVNATSAHPSQEKFGVEEAVVSELVDFFEKEKLCSVEPGGKPCDHCAMCSSRGF
jgi:hypothetical protein